MNIKTVFSNLKIKKIRASKWLDGYEPLSHMPLELESDPWDPWKV